MWHYIDLDLKFVSTVNKIVANRFHILGENNKILVLTLGQWSGHQNTLSLPKTSPTMAYIQQEQCDEKSRFIRQQVIKAFPACNLISTKGHLKCFSFASFGQRFLLHYCFVSSKSTYLSSTKHRNLLKGWATV